MWHKKKLPGQVYAERVRAYEQYEREFDSYVQQARAYHQAEQSNANAQVDQFQADYEAGETKAVERYAELVLERSVLS